VAEQLPADAPHVSAVALSTTAILPPVTARFEVPVASGAGRAVPFVPPEASWTRYLPPAGIVPLSAVEPQLVLPDDAYWSVQPSIATELEPRLKSST
jgi:hypothetical protein